SSRPRWPRPAGPAAERLSPVSPDMKTPVPASTVVLDPIRRAVSFGARRGLLRLLCCTLLGGALLGSTVACNRESSAGQAGATSAPRKVRITTTNVPANGKLVFTGLTALVVNQGWLAKKLAERGAEIEWVPISGSATGPLINEGFANRSIDIASYGDLPSIIANAAGIRTQLIVPNGRGSETYLVVPNGSTARSILDLKGKRIAIHRGRPWELPLSRLIDSVGLTYDDFQILNLNPEAGASALVAGKVDALVTINAHLLAQKNAGQIIWSTAQAPADWKMRAELWASRDFVRQNPELTQLVATAYVRAEHWAAQLENRPAMLEVLNRSGLPKEVLEREYGDGEEWKNRWSPLFDAPVVAHYRHAIDYALDKKIIRNKFPVEEIYDERFSRTALRELGIEGFWSPATTPEG
ncbi:MAG TPA: ABC transporter substrate-binding protein, partial [Polyangiaceae bacterium]|nr:ABC transporter substrate-binding protein [Polyangiaceae bacterium]